MSVESNQDEGAGAPGEPEKRTLRLGLEYDGTAFAGWQVQPGLRTVQGELESAIGRILKEPEAAVTGAGRTDSGAHAIGQVAHVRTSSRIAPDSLFKGLNSVLERDVRVRRVSEAPPSFHARFSAIAKEYRYHVWHGEPAPPFLRSYTYAVRTTLDVAAMVEAARLFEGTHDLSSFRASHCTARTPVRTVYSARVATHGPMLVFAICARGFLQHMVRIISGTLVRVGRGQLKPADVERIIAARDRRAAPATGPAHGLFLVRVLYPGEGGSLEALPEPVLNYAGSGT